MTFVLNTRVRTSEYREGEKVNENNILTARQEEGRLQTALLCITCSSSIIPPILRCISATGVTSLFQICAKQPAERAKWHMSYYNLLLALLM